MNNNDDKIYEIMSEALRLKDEGKTIPEILDLFVSYKDELREMFQIIGAIGNQKNNIIPPKELLNKIITNEEISRYLEREASINVKGRPSLEISQIHETMKFN